MILFMPVPIKLWALSDIATLSLLKSFPASNFAKDLESFQVEATSKQKPNKPNQLQNKQKPTTRKLSGILEVLCFNPLLPSS